jgi:hypothetical protein
MNWNWISGRIFRFRSLREEDDDGMPPAPMVERTGFLRWPVGPEEIALLPSPYDHPIIWIWRDGWREPIAVLPSELDPAMNVWGLVWRPAGKPGAAPRGRVEIDA